MQIFVHANGLGGDSLALNVQADETVGGVLHEIEIRTNGHFPAADTVLCTGVAVLANTPNLSLSAVGVANGTTLTAGRRLKGGGGKKKAKVMPKVVAREKRHLPTKFACPFCDHHTVECKINKKVKPVIGRLACSTCKATFDCVTHSLAKPVDVYAKWIDECEKEEDAASSESEDDDEDDYLDDGKANKRQKTSAENDIDDDDTAGAAGGKSAKESILDESSSDIDDFED